MTTDCANFLTVKEARVTNETCICYCINTVTDDKVDWQLSKGTSVASAADQSDSNGPYSEYFSFS